VPLVMMGGDTFAHSQHKMSMGVTNQSRIRKGAVGGVQSIAAKLMGRVDAPNWATSGQCPPESYYRKYPSRYLT